MDRDIREKKSSDGPWTILTGETRDRSIPHATRSGVERDSDFERSLRHRFLPLKTARNFQMLSGQYEIEVVKELLSLPDPGRVAYDIGAHLGYMTLALAECVGQRGARLLF